MASSINFRTASKSGNIIRRNFSYVDIKNLKILVNFLYHKLPCFSTYDSYDWDLPIKDCQELLPS